MYWQKLFAIALIRFRETRASLCSREAQKRHDRFMELRHNFAADSSIVGTKLFIVPAEVASPISHRRMAYPDFAVGKRVFSDKLAVGSRLHCKSGGNSFPVEVRGNLAAIGLFVRAAAVDRDGSGACRAAWRLR